MVNQLKQASRDQIIMSIHVLWERGWEVSPEAIQEMLKIGSHVGCSLDKIETVSSAVIVSGAKEQWLHNFNPNSSFNQQYPRPWPIDQTTWKHQQREQ